MVEAWNRLCIMQVSKQLDLEPIEVSDLPDSDLDRLASIFFLENLYSQQHPIYDKNLLDSFIDQCSDTLQDKEKKYIQGLNESRAVTYKFTRLKRNKFLLDPVNEEPDANPRIVIEDKSWHGPGNIDYDLIKDNDLIVTRVFELNGVTTTGLGMLHFSTRRGASPEIISKMFDNMLLEIQTDFDPYQKFYLGSYLHSHDEEYIYSTALYMNWLANFVLGHYLEEGVNLSYSFRMINIY